MQHRSIRYLGVFMKQLSKVNNLILSLYLFVMLGFFPLYYRYQYADMGDAKYKVFLYVSSVCVGISFLLCAGKGIFFYRNTKEKNIIRQKKQADIKKLICQYPLDAAIIVYFFTVVISFFLSDFKETAWKGADGWYMGFLSQILFVAVYFLIAKTWTYRPWVLALLGISSAMVFVIAIFHRFDVDLLPIYGDLAEKYKILFLSTMGQSSWYSGFLCTVFPIGLYIFFTEKDKKKRILAGIYSAIAMMSLVTQNTDSAFLSLFAVMMVLFYLSFDGRIKELLEVIILILASFCFMGICQRIFAERMIPIDTLSLFMSQGVLVWIAFIAVTGLYLWKYGKERFPDNANITKKKKSTGRTEQKQYPKTVFWAIIIGLITAVLLVILFIIANTTGCLQDTFGYQSTNNYLLFNDRWGNNRGFAWNYAVTTYAEMPLLKKLFGVGPDCFAAYGASILSYAERMRNFWGNLVLTNAHNEYLTKLYTLGIFGLFSYVTMLITGVAAFMKNRDKNPILPALALCIVSYMAHNIFCYEQVCCTPFFYILMGIGNNLIYNQEKKSTY